MKKKIPNTTLFGLLAFFILSGPLQLLSQSTLEPGDIAFTGYISADDNNLSQDDAFTFVLLKDIDTGTEIFFTDLGHTDAGTLQGIDPCGAGSGAYNDGIIRWTASSVMTCGTSVSIQCKRALTASAGTVTGIQATFNNPNAYLSLNTAGDQLFAYQGSSSAPIFINGIGINRNWDTLLDSCDFTSLKSTLPSTLIGIAPALTSGAVNAQYNCSITTGDTLSLLSAIGTVANWNTDSTPVPPVPSSFLLPPPCSFSGCALPSAQILSSPASQTVCQNTTLSFGVSATNAVSYRWQMNTGSNWIDVVDTLPYSGSTTDSLTITDAPFSLNNVQYRCVVNGAAPPAVISNAATLTVRRSPIITGQTPARAICEGLNVNFSVSASGFGLTYQWQFDNGNGWTNLTNTPPYSGATTSAIQIAATPFSLHLTNYRCIVNGGCAPADTSDPVYVFVNLLPSITVEPVSDSICTGSSTSFFINAIGASISFRWQVNTGNGFTNLSNIAPFSGANNDTLILSNPGLIYNGALFRCVVSGVCSPADTSLPVTLSVAQTPALPVFTTGSTNLCDNTAGNLFSVQALDNYSAYTWSFNGSGSTLTTSGDTTASIDLAPGAGSGTLTVQAQNYCGTGPINQLNISVGTSYVQNDTLRICIGDSVLIHGSWQQVPGDYSIVLSTADGCDSVLTTTLENLPAITTQLSVFICSGDSAFIAGGWQSAAGVYDEILSAASGCDSTIQTTLSVLATSIDSVQISVCAGDSVFAGGNWQQLPGIYTDTLSNFIGCDSIVVSTVNILQPVMDSVQLSICAGDSVFAGGSWQTSPGVYTDVLTSVNGCDSIVESTLTVLPIASDSTLLSICAGDSAFIAGSWQSTPGIYSESFNGVNGCDSVFYTTLQVLALPPVSAVLDTVLCTGSAPILLYGGSPAGGSWSGTAVNNNTFDPAALAQGIYLLTYTFSDASGCTASAGDTITLVACTGIATVDTRAIRVYPNPAHDHVIISSSTDLSGSRCLIADLNGRLLQVTQLSGTSQYLDLSKVEKGVYFLQIIGEQGVSTHPIVRQ